MTFEDKMKRLNEITKEMESDKLSLDKSLELYKEGTALAADCKKTLEETKLAVKTMNGEKTDE